MTPPLHNSHMSHNFMRVRALEDTGFADSSDAILGMAVYCNCIILTWDQSPVKDGMISCYPLLDVLIASRQLLKPQCVHTVHTGCLLGKLDDMQLYPASSCYMYLGHMHQLLKLNPFNILDMYTSHTYTYIFIFCFSSARYRSGLDERIFADCCDEATS